MSEQRKQVLEMLAEGKISPEDAERLLEKLEPSGHSSGRQESSQSSTSRPPKYLRVVVACTDGDAVNVRVPMALLRAGIKLGSVVPEGACQELKEQGIDLSKLSGLEGEELIEALRDLTVDIKEEGGDTVKVYCE
jgi:hypothetical protein